MHTGADTLGFITKLERIGLAYTRDFLLSDSVLVCYFYSSGSDRIAVTVWIWSSQVLWGRTDPIQNWSRCEARLIFIIKHKGFLYAVGSLFHMRTSLDRIYNSGVQTGDVWIGSK